MDYIVFQLNINKPLELKRQDMFTYCLAEPHLQLPSHKWWVELRNQLEYRVKFESMRGLSPNHLLPNLSLGFCLACA